MASLPQPQEKTWSGFYGRPTAWRIKKEGRHIKRETLTSSRHSAARRGRVKKKDAGLLLKTLEN